MKKSLKKGFTMTELLVTISLFTVIMAAIYTTFAVGNRSWAMFNTNAMLQRETRDAMIQMSKELRKAKDILVIRDEQNVRINFIRPSLGPVSYIWSSTGAEANTLVRKNQAVSKILATNVTALSFEYLKDSVVIDLTSEIKNKTGEMATFRLKEKVALRR